MINRMILLLCMQLIMWLISSVASVLLQMFRQLHNAYVDMLCNPFYIPGESITSRFHFVALQYNSYCRGHCKGLLGPTAHGAKAVHHAVGISR